MNRSDIIEILALLRLGRFERLDHCLALCQPGDIAVALERMNDDERLIVLERLEPDQRHLTLMALDYPTWLRLVDSAGPMSASGTGAAQAHSAMNPR